MHVFFCHLEEILPSQLSDFVLLNCSVQVALIDLITTAIRDHPSPTFMLSCWVHCTCATGTYITYFFFKHRWVKRWYLFEVGFIIAGYCFKRFLLLNDLCKLGFKLWGLHLGLLCFHLLPEIFVYLYAYSFLMIYTSWLFLCDWCIFACDNGLKSCLLYSNAMNYDFKYFDELILTYIVLIEAKLLNSSKDLQLVIDL